MGSQTQHMTNYAAYIDPDTALPRVGHLDLESGNLQPLSFLSGTPVQDLYQVIEAGTRNINAAGSLIPASSVKKLPPISGRDVLAVGKNYMEHAREFNNSGYDSSDKVDRPSHPVIFTKRATSIIADGEDIYPHAGFTESLDYEGEIGVIVGKAGFRISEQDAWEHVWGYTIVNDVTARERQRDHKQFYIGKSADTFCPMGPIAVPKEDLPSTLRVQTHVNGAARQDATTKELIFSIPTLIATLSAGQTLQPGDVIATGTPAGVGIGKKPPVFLQPGDEISVTVDGLGTLRNRIASPSAANATVDQVSSHSAFTLTNAAKTIGGRADLTQINSKPLHYQRLGSGDDSIVFVHGLGGTKDYWSPLISALSLTEKATLHLFDFEGHGLSPTHPLSALSIESLACDLAGVFQLAGVSASKPATLVAHSMGCLVAMRFALDNPSLVGKLVLVGPPPSPLPKPASEGSYARAALARTKGMAAVVDAVVGAGTSERTKRENPVAVAAVRLSLLGQDPEAYAKACQALAGSGGRELEVEGLGMPTVIVTGDEDKVSPPALCDGYVGRMGDARRVVLEGVGHWHVYEDVKGVAESLRGFL
ncbi:Bifunctional 4-hydroxyphenylacetate degradation enzyme [Coniochaeta hoffmannii]|uniref:Bifunctional 4-hydroxyphenylacetate degradation enzyme n=1 Tax=Coniochaeta hoffmannii TaxID=91930 RepID=A0AA38VM03_9PEZI|nr:Bifunctional 4-hydroxyphenylacetate degradation enzyme [Coniochaeta hoffmannii]